MTSTRLRAGGFTILALLASAIACASASASFPGADGEIAFTSVQNGPRHIFVVSGLGDVDLTGASSHATETQPAFSPNGKKIAFTRSQQIWVMTAAGNKRTKLTTTKAANSDPAWSPDGKKLAFVSDRKGSTDVWVMRADGTHATRLTKDSAVESGLVWSPAGSRIAFGRVHAGGNSAVYSIKPDGSKLKQLASPGQNPDYSPDGSQLVFSGDFHPSPPGSEGGDLWLMNANGSGEVPYIHEGTSFYSDGDYPAWSPDGAGIAFAANNGTGYYHVFEAPAGGASGSEAVVTNNQNGNPLDQEISWQALP